MIAEVDTMDEFRNGVQEYCSIDERVRQLQADIKNLKQQQQSLGEVIMHFMTSQNLEVCNAGDLGVLTIQTSNTKSALNKDAIREGLLTCMKSSKEMTHEEFADHSADFIVNNRETEERKRLRRKKVNNK
jgi:hypothetical protein